MCGIEALLCLDHKLKRKKTNRIPAISTIFSCLFFLNSPLRSSCGFALFNIDDVIFCFLLLVFVFNSFRGAFIAQNEKEEVKLDFMLCHSPQQPRFVLCLRYCLCCVRCCDYMGSMRTVWLFSVPCFMFHGGQKSKSINITWRTYQIGAFDLNVSILHWMNMINSKMNQPTEPPSTKNMKLKRKNNKLIETVDHTENGIRMADFPSIVSQNEESKTEKNTTLKNSENEKKSENCGNPKWFQSFCKK